MICPRAESSGEINKIRFKLANKGCCIYSYHRSATAAFLRPGLAQRYISQGSSWKTKDHEYKFTWKIPCSICTEMGDISSIRQLGKENILSTGNQLSCHIGGTIAMGSMKLRPILCSTPNILSFIRISSGNSFLDTWMAIIYFWLLLRKKTKIYLLFGNNNVRIHFVRMYSLCIRAPILQILMLYFTEGGFPSESKIICKTDLRKMQGH